MLGAIARKMGIGRAARRDRARDEQVRELSAKLRLALRAKYDAAQTTGDNQKHWANADALSANAANSKEVRQRLRDRSRYEIANNCFAHGIAQTVANDCVGTGPRVQLLSDSDADNQRVERLFAEWANEIDLASKLRTMRIAKLSDGEGFGILTTNPALQTPVTLDLRLLEADQIASPYVTPIVQPVDGITFDDYGNPAKYQILKTHPGELRITSLLEYDELPASSVLHYFTAIRPGQARGVPEITPALPLFGQLRRYTLAVIAAAEVAADLALVLHTDAPADDNPAVSPEAMDTIEFEKRMATVLPEGWKLGQAKAEQPTTTYDAFQKSILREIARCLSVPFNVAAGDSSGYNYSSGRLDHQTYYKSLHVERSRLRRTVLDRIFFAWLDEAALISGYLPQAFRRKERVPHQWFWDGMEHVDPQKEAAAQQTRLANHTTTLAEEFGRRGKDWQAELHQIASEQALMRELGITPSSSAPAAPADESETEEIEDGAEAEA